VCVNAPLKQDVDNFLSRHAAIYCSIAFRTDTRSMTSTCLSVTSVDCDHIVQHKVAEYRVGHKTGPLCLTVHIFKMPEPICVIFSILNIVLFCTHLLNLY